ncbi:MULTISPECIES: hypothetical protein [Alkalihalophilus]|uniref:Uncharacterized protein n=1 Tax=Alkalihalophilus pseudofirmus (strain ATCC BAA-2126 / JCM 17055 / OF4) TaxID=398511 RepID=D3FTK7_ALKPO|nr:MULTISPECIES: hypothetical protein [Alkalihalophilus]ADC50080.1 hypothetical protein BpOF4_10125 [Alkalihalophilus pseudofirmus OF4]MEC2072281.1 hypothetical protein [Alkalihalophilus marmarensis]MED1599829.1 hypothetical protein [Alkalihalophilus marmarensis]
METVCVQEKTFYEDDIPKLLSSIDPNSYYKVRSLVYYPYYLFEYRLDARGLLKLKGNIGCTVDSISGRGAIIDQKPILNSTCNINNDCLSPKMTLDSASHIAEEYLFHSASLKMKFLSMPKMKLINQQLFYRPFWIVSYNECNKENPPMIVDGISGTYHPI